MSSSGGDFFFFPILSALSSQISSSSRRSNPANDVQKVTITVDLCKCYRLDIIIQSFNQSNILATQ